MNPMSVLLRILIIEDSADDAEVALLELARGGITAETRRIESATELVAALAVGPWNAVLSDYTLPGFGASEAFALCRAADPDLPFVVVSGTIGEQRAVEMMRAGAGDFLLKGNLGRLAAVVEREVREAKNRRARRQEDLDTALLASVVESSDDAILTKSLDGVITSWNPGAERLYGWTAVEATGSEITMLVPPDREQEFAEIMARLKQGEHVPSFETVRLRKDGMRIEVAVTASCLKDRNGRLCGYSWIVRDIGVRKRAEAAKQASDERLRQFVEHVSAPIAMLDREMRYLHVSRRWLIDYNLGERDLTGLSHYDVFPDAPWEWKEIHRRCLAGEIVRRDEDRFERGDGSIQWLRWEVRP